MDKTILISGSVNSSKYNVHINTKNMLSPHYLQRSQAISKSNIEIICF